MWDRLKAFVSSVPTATSTDGHRLYAIGDIHGRDDLLGSLLETLAADAANSPDNILIFLGDYIDRGARSAEVLARLCHFRPAWARLDFLLGNHEQIFIDLLHGRGAPKTIERWLDYGGRETLMSYGLSSRDAYGAPPAELAEKLRAAVPPDHRHFLDGLALSVRYGDYFFTHAGIRPGVALAAQNEQDMLWIREPFLSSKAAHGAVVVHGHSISEQVDNLPNRIGIDTGAYATGRLTAVVLEGATRRFVTTGVPS